MSRTPSPGALERAAQIAEQYESGWSMQAIGDHHGITRERVRQILSALEVPARDATESWEMHYQTWVSEFGPTVDATFNEYLSTTDVIDAFPEVPSSWIRRYLEPRQHEVVLRSNREQYWSNDQMIAAMRAAADGAPSLSVKTYGEWREAQGEPLLAGPTKALIMWRFGSWSDAVIAAGLEPLRSNRRTYERRWSAKDATAAVVEFVTECRADEERPTFARYDTWARGHDEHPSAAYVRYLTGMSWSELVMTASRLVLAS